MASYTKQMIDVANTWLEANTDPADPFLKFPRISTAFERDDDQKHQISEIDRKLASHPHLRASADLKEQSERLRKVMAERDKALGEVRELEKTVERGLNKTLETKHQKFGDGGPMQAYLGRWCLAWARHGYNTFEISPDFAAAMLLTDPRELDISSVRMPFRGILFLIPADFAKGHEGGHYTKIHITEITRQDAKLLDTFGKVVDVLEDVDPKVRQYAIDKMQTANRLLAGTTMLGNAASRLEIMRPAQSDPHAAKLLHIHATDGTHALSTIIDLHGLTWDAFETLESDVEFTADVQAMRAVRQIVFGALAYATAIPSATTEVPVGRRRGSGPAPKRWEIGRTIKIDHQLVRSVRSGAREVLYRLKHRHIVRGHYRNQAHGPNRSLRTTMWIAPHWKGPEDGAALVHTYKLATEPESTNG